MTNGERPAAKFSVDTHLFRELGELLVGRESTALIELVKNAYDADATEITVYGENLGDPNRGIIRIIDNGVGMDPDTFHSGFLRVAARIKNKGDRKSKRWGRRFTGAKGVGRLSAHKLARHIQVQSIPWTPSGSVVGVVGVDGLIDWDKVEQAETLDQIAADAVVTHEKPVKNSRVHGTTLTLSRLRQKWTPTQRGRFLLEVESLRAPVILTSPLPKTVVSEVALFDRPTFVDAKSTDPGFTLELEGDFQTGDNYWPAVVESAGWVVEIDVAPNGVRYVVAPTKRTLREFPHARQMAFSENHPAPRIGPYFHARILIREGQARGKKDERTWESRIGGVRVYMEGFRVLPYGEDSDDWLALGRDTTDRSRKLRFLTDSSAPGKLTERENEGLFLLPNKHYFGGVFLTANRAGTLQMLVNREGFVPDDSFEHVVTLVRRGIDLSTRVRVATKISPASGPTNAERDRPTEREHEASDRTHEDSQKWRTEGPLRRLTDQANRLKSIATGAPDALKQQLMEAAVEIDQATADSREMAPANSMVLVLASVGTQLAAFTHEVNRLLGLAADLETTVTRLREEELPPKLKNYFSRVSSAASDLRRAIERQAAYLVDIVTPDARRRRSRLNVADTLNATWKLVATSAEQRGTRFRNDVEAEARTPPMFRAELMAVFTNMFTNAVKSAGVGGIINAATEVAEDGTLRLRLENTGTAVDLGDGERWFRPFESTTLDVDPVLGQGMGLGLGITRDLLLDVGADISFVRPRQGYATALEIIFPGAAQ